MNHVTVREVDLLLLYLCTTAESRFDPLRDATLHFRHWKTSVKCYSAVIDTVLAKSSCCRCTKRKIDMHVPVMQGEHGERSRTTRSVTTVPDMVKQQGSLHTVWYAMSDTHAVSTHYMYSW